MKRYRIKYWLGGMITEYFTSATNEEEVLKKFAETKGQHKVIAIEEV